MPMRQCGLAEFLVSAMGASPPRRRFRPFFGMTFNKVGKIVSKERSDNTKKWHLVVKIVRMLNSRLDHNGKRVLAAERIVKTSSLYREAKTIYSEYKLVPVVRVREMVFELEAIHQHEDLC